MKKAIKIERYLNEKSVTEEYSVTDLATAAGFSVVQERHFGHKDK